MCIHKVDGEDLSIWGPRKAYQIDGLGDEIHIQFMEDESLKEFMIKN